MVIEYIEGLVEAYPGLQFLDGFPQVDNFISFCILFKLQIGSVFFFLFIKRLGFFMLGQLKS